MGLNVYLHGPRGIGRTSFLRQIERSRPEARYARLHGFDTLTERLDEVERRLTEQRVLSRQGPNPLASTLQAFSGTRLVVAEDPFQYLRAAANEATDQPPSLVLLDDLDSASIHEMFGRWRDSVWEIPLQWVVSGTNAHLDPPADTFFDVVVELQRFDFDGLQELVRRRAESGTPEERRVLQQLCDSALATIAPCTPRQALSVVRDLYLSDDLEREASQLKEMQLARSRLKTTPARILEALGIVGPTHAGDEQLLAEVGVTRSRVVQVLAELEAEGLVTAERVGRRKLYSAYPKRVGRSGEQEVSLVKIGDNPPAEQANPSERKVDSPSGATVSTESL
ncbi:MAG: helix-turn-helix domain-containing protein [Acidimicrobiaceae bacterium]|nr:helix-turn-helix domain-containing protein [Acidimicrobiaceae bacterium]